MNIYFVMCPQGNIIRQVAPAWTLDQLYQNMAQYATGEEIKTSYAVEAIAECMTKEGYQIVSQST